MNRTRKYFFEGMNKLNAAAAAAYDREFMQLDKEQKHQLLVQVDDEQKEHTRNKKEDERSHYFRMMKELTLLGYFTSEVGSTQALRYVESPGRYDGCIPYKKGDRAWALS